MRLYVMANVNICTEHLPFGCKDGKFDTATEAAYPAKFCHTLVKAVVEALQLKGINIREPPVKASKLAAIVAGKQPPKKVPSLVQEFAQVVAIKGVDPAFNLSVTQKQILSKCYKFVDKATKHELTVVHVGSKLLRRTSINGGTSGAPISVVKQQQLGTVDSSRLDFREFSANQFSDEVAFGCPWDPVVFLKEVCKVGHPQDFFTALPREVELAISTVASSSPQDVVIRRCQWLGKYVALAKELEDENKVMLDQTPHHMRRVIFACTLHLS